MLTSWRSLGTLSLIKTDRVVGDWGPKILLHINDIVLSDFGEIACVMPEQDLSLLGSYFHAGILEHGRKRMDEKRHFIYGFEEESIVHEQSDSII